MAKYLMTYTETLERTYIVEAENYEDAYAIIEEAVRCEDIVLDSYDFMEYEIDGKAVTGEYKKHYPVYTPTR